MLRGVAELPRRGGVLVYKAQTEWPRHEQGIKAAGICICICTDA